MIKDFIKIQETRVRITMIKKYIPMYETKLNVYYNSSKSKPEFETFTFLTHLEREEVVETLDTIFL